MKIWMLMIAAGAFAMAPAAAERGNNNTGQG